MPPLRGHDVIVIVIVQIVNGTTGMAFAPAFGAILRPVPCMVGEYDYIQLCPATSEWALGYIIVESLAQQMLLILWCMEMHEVSAG